MRIILTSDIDDIGLAGEVKTVKNGLARNYLIPHKLAVEATESNLRDLAKKLEVLKQKREKTIADAQTFAEKIEGKVISIESRVREGEKMFGSVNTQMIAEALKEQHEIEVEKKNILLEKNIKVIGRFEVPVRVKAHIKSFVVVEIKAENEDDKENVSAQDGQENEDTQVSQDTEQTRREDGSETGETSELTEEDENKSESEAQT